MFVALMKKPEPMPVPPIPVPPIPVPPNPIPEPNPNRVIVGSLTYFSNRIIGLGSFHTVVYEGESNDKRKMAIKKMPIEIFATAEREVTTAVKLDHKNIVTFYNREMDEEKKYVYLGLGYCEGTLKDIIVTKSKIEDLNKKPDKKGLIEIYQ
jgi:serine/threonine protein kinase